jgi:YfiH family protein
MSDSRPFLFVPRLNEIGALVHGFGTRDLDRDRFSGLSAALNLKPVFLRQIHSDRIFIADRVSEEPPRADALVTSRPGVLLVVQTADCLPLLLADPRLGLAAAVHCGWRGTAARLAPKVVSLLRARFSSRGNDLLAALGPCIQGGCYEVGEDVRRAFETAGLSSESFFSKPGEAGRIHLDLRDANRRQLLESGLRGENIFDAGGCTRCQDAFFSYRRDPSQAGRQFNFIGFRD